VAVWQNCKNNAEAAVAIKSIKINKYIRRSLVCFMFLFNVLAYANSGTVMDLNGQLKASLEAFIQENNLAGAVLSYKLRSHDPATLAVGYQDVEKKTPLSPDSYFAIGSATKVFLSSQIMQQVALGKITVNETLLQVARKYPGKRHVLLELVEQYPHLGIITLRQYLTHTSGIGKSLNSELFIKEYNKNPMGYWDSKQLITIAMQRPPYFAPGTKGLYSYTNTDYEVMSMVLEAVTGKSLYENMTRFFHETGLENIYYTLPRGENLPPEVMRQMAHAYVLPESVYFDLPMFESLGTVTFPGGQIAKDITPYSINFAAIGAASGGIIAQPKTLVNWYWKLFHSGVVPQKVFDQMLDAVPTGTPDKQSGFGIIIQTSKKYGTIYGHSGISYGYAANVVYVPKYNIVFSVAVNASTKDPDKLIDTMVMNTLAILAKKNLGAASLK